MRTHSFGLGAKYFMDHDLYERHLVVDRGIEGTKGIIVRPGARAAAVALLLCFCMGCSTNSSSNGHCGERLARSKDKALRESARIMRTAVARLPKAQSKSDRSALAHLLSEQLKRVSAVSGGCV